MTGPGPPTGILDVPRTNPAQIEVETVAVADHDLCLVPEGDEFEVGPQVATLAPVVEAPVSLADRVTQ